MKIRLCHSLFLGFALLYATPAVAGDFDVALKEARRAYTNGDTKRAAKLLSRVIRMPAPSDALAGAYLLLGAAQSAADRAIEARVSVRRALELDPRVTYDPTRFPPALIDLFHHVRATMRGRVAVRCDRKTAVVEIDGRPSGHCGNASDVAVGMHTVRVSEGRRFEERRVVVALDGVANLEVTLGPSVGRLSIVTSPRGATVRLDGVPIGTTPIDNIEVAPGRHQVGLELRGFQSVTSDIVVESDAPHAVSIALGKTESPRPMTATIAATPAPMTTLRMTPPLPPPNRAKRILGWTLLGTAGASLAVGALFGILQRNTVNDFNASKGSGALSVDDASRAGDRASTQATVANAMFITASASALSGLVLLIADSIKEKK